jgi:hypothetical protein
VAQGDKARPVQKSYIVVEADPMSDGTRYLGLDVSKANIPVAVAESDGTVAESAASPTTRVRSGGW